MEHIVRSLDETLHVHVGIQHYRGSSYDHRITYVYMSASNMDI